jgi:hypothetical protein
MGSINICSRKDPALMLDSNVLDDDHLLEAYRAGEQASLDLKISQETFDVLAAQARPCPLPGVQVSREPYPEELRFSVGLDFHIVSRKLTITEDWMGQPRSGYRTLWAEVTLEPTSDVVEEVFLWVHSGIRPSWAQTPLPGILVALHPPLP